MAVKSRLGMNVFDMAASTLPDPGPTNILGDHAKVCSKGGERICRHNDLTDAIHNTTTSAGLNPRKEVCYLLTSNSRKPADAQLASQ